MTKQTVLVVIFFRQDGTTAQELSYEYDSSSQEDIIATASTIAHVMYKMDQLDLNMKVALGVRVTAPADFNPYLTAAVNKVREANGCEWNISTRRKPAETQVSSKPTKSAAQSQPADVE